MSSKIRKIGMSSKHTNRTCHGCKADGSDGKGHQCGAKLAGLVTSTMLGNPTLYGLRRELSTSTPVFGFRMHSRGLGNFPSCSELLKKRFVSVGNIGLRFTPASNQGNAGYH